MKVVLLTAVIVTLTPLHEGQGVSQNLEPCQLRSDIKEYRVFVTRHIISGSFDKDSLEEWASYLRSKDLCGRVPTQSFIDAKAQDVKKICSYYGRLVRGAPPSEGDYCISASMMKVYNVKSDKDCKVSSAILDTQYVVVQCAAVDRTCLPIHYGTNRNRMPSSKLCWR